MSAILSTMIEVHWVVSVKVASSGDTVGIARPERTSVVGGVQHEAIRVLSKTVKTWILWESSAEAEVLILEDEGSGRRVEKNLLVGFADHTEGEGGFLVGEFQIGSICGDRAGVVWSGEDRGWDLVCNSRAVFNLDMKTFGCFNLAFNLSYHPNKAHQYRN